MFFGNIFIYLNGWYISIILLLGFTIIILVFFIFINLNHKKGNYLLFQFPTLSENSFKFILLILLSISIFFPPVLSNNSIILWEKLHFFNYFRAIIAILGCTFLPGANLYKIIFSNDKLSDYFGIDPILIKITLIPILLFAFLGIVVLIFDQLGSIKAQIEIFLFITILILFLIDITSK